MKKVKVLGMNFQQIEDSEIEAYKIIMTPKFAKAILNNDFSS